MSNMGKIHFINISEKKFLASTSPLFKMVSNDNIDNTIGHNPYLWFANPQKWKDPFERRFIEVRYLHNGKKYDYPLKNKVFCCCFSLTRITEAQWYIYSKGGDCVCMNINRSQLIDELKQYIKSNPKDNIYIGRAEYQPTNIITGSIHNNPIFKKKPFSLSDNESLVKLLLLKRNAFIYEDELRIIIVKGDSCDGDGIKFSYRCAITDLIQRIILSPMTNNTYSNMLENFLGTYYGFTPGINSLGKPYKRVVKSKLYKYKHPTYVIV